MKKLLLIGFLGILTACATSMTPREFVHADLTCKAANAHFEAQQACLNDFLLTRNEQSADFDVYYRWVREREAIMSLYQSGGVEESKIRLALLDAQNKYEHILYDRDMRHYAAIQAMEARRPYYCTSTQHGDRIRTYCD